MVDPTQKEIDAMLSCSQPAGEYLESIKKTDLATMTEEEWMTFIEIICTAYVDSMTKTQDEAK